MATPSGATQFKAISANEIYCPTIRGRDNNAGVSIYIGSGSSFNGATTTFAEGADLTFGTTTGTKIGEATAQKIGFWNATPVVQPAGADQADQGAMTAGAGSGADGTTPSGAEFAEAVADIVALDTLLTAIRTALVDAGIMKGAA